MATSPRAPAAPRTSLLPLLPFVVAAVLATALLGPAPHGRAELKADFAADEGWTWSDHEPLLAAGADEPRAVRLEVLPDGRPVALLVANGDDYGHPAEAVLVTRVREGAGVWSAPEVTPMGAPWSGTAAPQGRTFDTFADSTGRVLAVWAVKSATAGQWPVMSVARGADGTWTAPEEVYVARSNGDLSDPIEIGFVRPQLVGSGDTATVAWASVAGAPGSSIDTGDNPFRARRWTAGAWGPTLTSDGTSAETGGFPPYTSHTTRVVADPSRAVRASDGRISFVFTLRKQRPLHTMEHPLSEGFVGEPNLANVWDGIPEPRTDAANRTAWVVHLDPGGGWGPAAKLVSHADLPVACALPALPEHPPMADHWQEWKSFSQSPGIHTSCGYGEDSRATSATYAPDGDLRIGLGYRSGAAATVEIQQFLDIPCDQAGSNTYRFCFDDWGAPDWSIDWAQARIRVPAGADRPSPDSVAEGAWEGTPPDASRLDTDAGSVTVSGHGGPDGKAIVFDRSPGADVTWTPDATAAGAVTVSHAFANDDDVAVFYAYGAEPGSPRCAMAVLRAGQTVPEVFDGCMVGAAAYLKDVVQLPDGTLARLDGSRSQASFRLFSPTADPPAEPTVLHGTPGDDVLVATPGITTVHGYGGDDTITVSTGAGVTVRGGGGDDTVKGGAGKDRLYGAAGKDRLVGNGGNDLLDGGGSVDTLSGSAGDDTARGAGGSDRLTGAGGRDALYGGGGNDHLHGGGGANRLFGNAGTDTCHRGAKSSCEKP